MANVRSLSHGRLRVWLGNGGSPEVFASAAGFTDKGFEVTGDTNDQYIPDDTDGDLPTFVQKIVTKISAKVTAKGVLHMTDLATWRQWALSGVQKNIRLDFGETGANGGGYYQGSAFLSSFKASSQTGEKVQIEVTIEMSGALVFTANP